MNKFTKNFTKFSLILLQFGLSSNIISMHRKNMPNNDWVAIKNKRATQGLIQSEAEEGERKIYWKTKPSEITTLASNIEKKGKMDKEDAQKLYSLILTNQIDFIQSLKYIAKFGLNKYINDKFKSLYKDDDNWLYEDEKSMLEAAILGSHFSTIEFHSSTTPQSIKNRLSKAITEKQLEIIKILIENGAKIDDNVLRATRMRTIPIEIKKFIAQQKEIPNAQAKKLIQEKLISEKAKRYHDIEIKTVR